MKAFYFLLVLLIPFVGFGQIPSYVTQNGLVGWWPFNQNSLDESDNALHLNPQGDALLVEDRFFALNSAYRFTTNDNNSRLLFNEDAYSVINDFSEGSISIWIKINEHNITEHYFQNDNIFFAKQTDGSNTELLLALRGGTTKIRAHVSNSMPSSVFESITELTVGNWHNVIFTWGNGAHKIYIDGVLDSQQNSNITLSDNSSPTFMGVGALPGIGTNTCNSDIDDIGIWNRTLNDDEITDIFNSCENTFGTDTQVHCDTYTWIDGNSYTESNNTATFTLINSNNCDSIVTLDLIINNSDNTSSSVTACDEFTWDGITYTESGEYTNTYTNNNGCDSIVTLDLLITQSSSSYDTVVVCDSYDWNGNTYTESGNYVYTSSNTIGCDSVANLDLSISQLEALVIDGEQIGYTETDNNTYSISNSNASSTYFWNLSNNLGTIESGNANNSEITISWGENDSETTLCVYEQDEYSCEGEESCITIDVKRPTSIDDIKESLLSIYPNPFKNQTTVSFSNRTQSKAILKLIDSRGRTVRNYDGITGDSIIIKKEKLSEGLYYIQLNLNNNVIRKPIVIQ